MSSNEFYFGPQNQLDQRKDQLDEFLDVVFFPEDRPLFISDEASYFDVDTDDVEDVIGRIASHYKVELKPSDLSKPIWQVLDYLESKRQDIRSCSGLKH